jgi:hypothetical protein
MSSADYERLLAELTHTRTTAISTDRAASQRHTERTTELAGLEDRLLGQQADLLHTAAMLRLRAPRLRPDPDEAPTTGDFTEAIAAANRETDSADAAVARALRRARLPKFLPAQRMITRHLAVYAICAVTVAALENLALAVNPLTEVAWLFAAAPAAGFLAGYLLVGAADRPHLKPTGKRRDRGRAPSRNPKLGLTLCLVASFATATWWLLR